MLDVLVSKHHHISCIKCWQKSRHVFLHEVWVPVRSCPRHTLQTELHLLQGVHFKERSLDRPEEIDIYLRVLTCESESKRGERNDGETWSRTQRRQQILESL